jgi:diguanylate cyclase (GGDEF)-like protein
MGAAGGDVMVDPVRADAPVESGESVVRDAKASERDRISVDRDGAADQRDVEAAERDLVAFVHDEADGLAGLTRESDRDIARGDRASAADDRLHAAEDREAAAADRSRAADYSDSLLLDSLTHLYRRGAGLNEIKREIKKAQRTKEPLVLAFIDVDHLKEMNDAHGHGAGDRLLGRVATAIRRVVRDYDVVVRYGGDEFLCCILGLDVVEAQARFDGLNATLAAHGGGTASVGVVQLEQGEALEHAIARADAAMYEAKKNNGQHTVADSVERGDEASR